MEEKKFIQRRLLVIALFLAIAIFGVYLDYIFKPICWHYGYSLCAAVGEDFFHLYQAGYNFFHGYFIYGAPAEVHLVAPYFVVMRYFPATPLIWSSPFLFFKNAIAAYQIYLIFSVILHLASIGLIYLIAKKLNTSKIMFVLATILWLTYFPLASEWRMGQFNHLAGIFFLLAITFSVYRRPVFSAISWILSLGWKPLTLFAFFYYWLKKNKLAIWLFLLFFVIFTCGYLIYWQRIFPFAWQEFLKTILILEDRSPVQIHYIDNFSVFALWGELFYNWSPLFYGAFTKVYLLAILVIFFYLTFKKGPKNLYYLLFAAATMMMFHREVWESILTFWLPILVVLILMAKKKNEIIFLLICSALLAMPSLYYYFDQSKNPVLLSLMIIGKALPQLALYGYLLVKQTKSA